MISIIELQCRPHPSFEKAFEIQAGASSEVGHCRTKEVTIPSMFRCSVQCNPFLRNCGRRQVVSRNNWRVLVLGVMSVLTFISGMCISAKTMLALSPLPEFPRNNSFHWIAYGIAFACVAYAVTVWLRKPSIVPVALFAGMVISPLMSFLMFVLFGGGMGLIAEIEHTPGIDPDWLDFLKEVGLLFGLTVGFAAIGWFLLRPLHSLGRRLRRMPPMPTWPN